MTCEGPAAEFWINTSCGECLPATGLSGALTAISQKLAFICGLKQAGFAKTY